MSGASRVAVLPTDDSDGSPTGIGGHFRSRIPDWRQRRDGFFWGLKIMVSITQTAYSRLAHKLTNQPDDVSVRITLQNGRVRFRPGRRRDGDTVFAHEGHAVLLVGTATAPRIANRILDTVDTSAGKRLRFVKAK